MFNSVRKMHEDLPFLSKNTIIRALAKLEDANLIRSELHNRLRGDKTKWYTLVPTEGECLYPEGVYPIPAEGDPFTPTGQSIYPDRVEQVPPQGTPFTPTGYTIPITTKSIPTSEAIDNSITTQLAIRPGSERGEDIDFARVNYSKIKPDWKASYDIDSRLRKLAVAACTAGTCSRVWCVDPELKVHELQHTDDMYGNWKVIGFDGYLGSQT